MFVFVQNGVHVLGTAGETNRSNFESDEIWRVKRTLFCRSNISPFRADSDRKGSVAHDLSFFLRVSYRIPLWEAPMVGYILGNTCVSGRDRILPVFVAYRGISAPDSIPQSPKELD